MIELGLELVSYRARVSITRYAFCIPHVVQPWFDAWTHSCAHSDRIYSLLNIAHSHNHHVTPVSIFCQFSSVRAPRDVKLPTQESSGFSPVTTESRKDTVSLASSKFYERTWRHHDAILVHSRQPWALVDPDSLARGVLGGSLETWHDFLFQIIWLTRIILQTWIIKYGNIKAIQLNDDENCDNN